MNIDTFLLAVVQQEDADAVTRALTHAGLAVTMMASVGGFLGTSNVTLLIGLGATDVERALDLLNAYCERRTVHTPRVTTGTTVGGATVLSFPVARYVHLGADRTIIDTRRKPMEPGKAQLVLAIVPKEQAGKLVEVLTDWSYHATLIGTTGGFLRRGNATLLVGVRSERVDPIVEQIRQVTEANSSEPMATIFVLDLDRLEHV